MGSAYLMVLALVLFGFAYTFYGRFVAKRLGIDPERPTPAHTMTDGVDYVPAKVPILFGHHFASIAGAAPIIGPITAAVFGWIPVYLWILLGSIFIGGVHDTSAIVASIRHQGKSIGEIIEEHVGESGKKLFLIFAWATLVLVVAVFTIVVAKTFVSVPAAATASILFLLLALLFGAAVYRYHIHVGLATLIGVILLFTCVYIGLVFPVQLSTNTWIYLLLAYIFVASVTPVWILLQPRDYLNSFLLYALIFGAVLGIFIGNPKVQLVGYSQFHTDLGYLFPILFVTVACGAISGFHSLVGSGTTAKQLDRESDARIIGYGGMLTEGLLAVVSLTAAAVLLKSDYASFLTKSGGGPIALFSTSVGNFMVALGIPLHVGKTFAALAVSAFALTSLDTATRLSRYAFQEFFETPGNVKQSILAKNRFIGTTVSVFFGGVLALSGQWKAIWPIFGSANQLLAALALLAVSVWLAQLGTKNAFTRYPMYFMFAVTLTALINLIVKNLLNNNYLLMVMAMLLFIVAVVLAFQAYTRMRKKHNSSVQQAG